MRYTLALLLSALIAGQAAAQLVTPNKSNIEFEEDKPWQEERVEPPAFPKDENLREYYVSPVATNKYFIDTSTILPGADGVVRYVLVVKTSGGATNVSFEGIRCKDIQWKHYASGRADGTWGKARTSEWRPIENKPINRHHAALSRDLFCPSGSAIFSADEGRDALRRGKHPNAN